MNLMSRLGAGHRSEITCDWDTAHLLGKAALANESRNPICVHKRNTPALAGRVASCVGCRPLKFRVLDASETEEWKMITGVWQSGLHREAGRT